MKTEVEQARKDLEPYTPPPVFKSCMMVFFQLSANRNIPEPITFSEINAYSQLYGKTFTYWELDAFKVLDNHMLDTYSRFHKD